MTENVLSVEAIRVGYGQSQVIPNLSLSVGARTRSSRSWGGTAWARPRCSRR